jgi:signal transduction histidine kinase
MMAANMEKTSPIYDQVIQQKAQGFITLDENEIITAVNDAAAQLIGLPAAALIGRSWVSLAEEQPAQTWPNVQTLAQQTAVSFANGQALVTAVSMTNSTLLTLTPQQTYQQLHEALAMTQRLAGIGLLTGSVSHELNNPVSIITTACGNLQMEFDNQYLGEERLARYLEMIETSAWRCARILNVLRHYSHEDDPQLAVTGLNMIVKDALTLLQHQFALQYKIKVETDFASDLKSIVCDHNRLTQVVVNLLTNARDAMQPTGGVIKVRTWKQPMSDEQNGSQRDWVAFSITDSGPGISQEAMAKLFTPFSSTKPKGAGLGLFVSRQIVEEHHGRILAENTPEGGAKFTVMLPRQP